jgi:RHS repeat-associated protein
MRKGAIFLTFLLVCSLALGQSHPNLDRGFDPAKVYQFGEVDAVDLYNGHLTLTIPLGPGYPVSERLSYGLTLTYNSNIWEYEQLGPSYNIVAYPKRAADTDWNAGLGFVLSLGEIVTRNGVFYYLPPDGGERKFFPTLRPNDTGDPDSYWYTVDGSYLRLRQLTSTNLVLEFPDGTRHEFARDPNNSNRYLLTKITDSYHPSLAYPNSVQVTHGASGIFIQDVYYRSHTINFATDTSAIPARYVTSVNLAAPDGKILTYTFSYSTMTIDRPCKHYCEGTSCPPLTVNGRFLTSVVASSDGQELLRWEFADYVASKPYSCRAGETGMLGKLVLPTRGIIQYEYADKALLYLSRNPHCERQGWPLECFGYSVAKEVTAVKKRTLLDPVAPSQGGTWTYAYYYHLRTLNDGPDPTEFTDEILTVVTDPAGNDAVHWFNPGVNSSGWDGQWYSGLPYTDLQGDGGGRSLSRRAYRGRVNVAIVDRGPGYFPGECAGDFCQVTPQPGAVLLRSVFSAYEKDDGDCSAWFGGTCNRREKAQRTYFHDDPVGCTVGSTCRFAGVFRDNFDGFGHYRREVAEGNFPQGANTRTTWTNYIWNGTAPSSIAPWVLGKYNYTTVQEGSQTLKKQFCFDADGFLLRTRTLASWNGTLQTKDLVTVYTKDTKGNTATESLYGGDTQAVSTGSDLCTLTLLAAPVYRLEHRWSYGVRSRSAWKDPATGGEVLVTLDQDIEPRTGLVLRSRDSAGMYTDYGYDALGRLTWVKPQKDVAGQPNGGAWTQIQYTLPPASDQAQLRVSTCPAGTSDCASVPDGSVLARQTYSYDGFGRLASHSRVIPHTTGNLAVRQFSYNALGWKLSESEWFAGGSSAPPRTSWADFDPFGRPGRMTLADGKQVLWSYTGSRLVTTQQTVATSSSGESWVVRAEAYDRFGRLVQVTEPSGAGGADVGTAYSYGVDGKVWQASTSEGAVTQQRGWSYDGRGFLLAEQLPEKGLYGNGSVTYASYDPLGKPGRVTDGPNDMWYSYDKAGRVVEVRGADGRVWRQFVYGTTNGFMNMAKGKLARQVANNYYDPNNASANFQVVEDVVYGGIGGRVSSKTTQAGVVGGYGGTFNQSFGWTELGDLAWESYPQKAGAGPARTVSYAYSRGYLTAVQEGSTTYASFSYHPSGLVARRQRSNGTRDEIVADSSGMARVGNIQVYGPGGSLLWQTGSYAYDGAGNVKAMGGDRYWYDKVSRLVGAQVGGKSFAASYNAFGFMTGMAKNGAWQTFVADAGGGTNRISGVGYDGAGQVTSFGGRVFGWYPTGQLRSVGWSGQSLTFGYDASGERMGWSDSTEVGVRYTFRGLSGQVLREYFELNGTWNWVKDYVWGGGELIATIEPTGTKHLHRDHLGSTRLETSGTGTVVATHTYWPFGEEMTATSSTERYRFAGHERDLGSGYDSMHARSYASVSGRFFSVDPARDYDFSRPQSFNLYAYVRNNPVSAVDPTGKYSWAHSTSSFRPTEVAGGWESAIGSGDTLFFRTMPQEAQGGGGAAANSSASPTGLSAEDEAAELLARLVYAEAGGEGSLGMAAVASVVMNRVASPQFPNTVKEVIHQKGQFQGVGSQHWKDFDKPKNAQERAAAAEARRIACEAVEGSLGDIVRGATYFAAYQKENDYGLPRGFFQEAVRGVRLVIVDMIGKHILLARGR